MIQFPSIPAPTSTKHVRIVDGFCGKNAVQDTAQGEMSMKCYSNGTATFTGRCYCDAGFYWSKYFTACFRKSLI